MVGSLKDTSIPNRSQSMFTMITPTVGCHIEDISDGVTKVKKIRGRESVYIVSQFERGMGGQL